MGYVHAMRGHGGDKNHWWVEQLSVRSSADVDAVKITQPVSVLMQLYSDNVYIHGR